MLNPVFLIVGGVDDPEVQWFLNNAKKLTTLPILSLLLGVEEYPSLTYNYQTDQLLINGRNIDPVMVWCRYNIYGASPEEELRYQRWHRIIQGWVLAHPGVGVLNRSWLNRINNKVYQLSVAKRLGIPIPKTIVSNVFSEMLPEEGKTKKIIKPVDNGHCKTSDEILNRIMHHDLIRINPQGYHEVTATPTFIQEEKSSPEYRVFIINETPFVFRIDSKYIDYRVDPSPVITPVDDQTFPEELMDKLISLAQELQLDYAAIDMKSGNGQLSFLEINDFPMFAAFDSLIEGKMVREICHFLEEKWKSWDSMDALSYLNPSISDDEELYDIYA